MTELRTQTTEELLLMEFQKQVCLCFERVIVKDIQSIDFQDDYTILGTYAYLDYFYYTFKEALIAYQDWLSYLEYGRIMNELSEQQQLHVEANLNYGLENDGMNSPDSFDGEILRVLETNHYVVFYSGNYFHPTVKKEDLRVINSPLQEVW